MISNLLINQNEESVEPGIRVCAIVVTYYPQPDTLLEVLKSTASQVDAIVVIDNTPGGDAGDLTKIAAATDGPTKHIIRLGMNRGVGAAQNTGIAWAQAQNAEYILLLDQDSIPGSNMVKQLTKAVNNLRAQGIPVAAVGPRYVDPHSGRTSRALQIGSFRTRRVPCLTSSPGLVVRSDTLIASGSLIRCSVLKMTGMIDESLFIDHVDHEWCLRARAKGLSCYMACKATLTHHLGSETKRYWLGRWRSFPVHDPARHYYMLRNIILLGSRSYIPNSWLLGELRSLISTLIFTLILLPDRRNRLLLVFRAIYDGFRNHRGML